MSLSSPRNHCREIDTVPVRNRRGSSSGILLSLLAVGALVVSCLLALLGSQQSAVPQAPVETGLRPEPSVEQYETNINPGPSMPRVATGLFDLGGNPVTASCSTCHSSREPNFDNRASADLDEFHNHVSVAHGSISCLSCHNEDNYDQLKLADGSSIAYENVMVLCSQCHGPQARDFQHGAHGGMQGFWDLSRGPRTKNNCVDCHSPHQPTFPKMVPTFKPRDRFLDSTHPKGSHD